MKSRLEKFADFYNQQEGRKFPCSNQIVLCGVVVSDREKALSIMKEKGAVIRRCAKAYPFIEWELNNERWVWRNWNGDFRGNRLYKVIIDKEIDKDTFYYYISPMCANYCCSVEII